VRARGRSVLDLFARHRANLSPGSYLGLQMTVGLLVFAAAAWLLGGIAEDVVTGDPLIASRRLVHAPCDGRMQLCKRGRKQRHRRN
jgi:hypothetical protein